MLKADDRAERNLDEFQFEFPVPHDCLWDSHREGFAYSSLLRPVPRAPRCLIASSWSDRSYIVLLQNCSRTHTSRMKGQRCNVMGIMGGASLFAPEPGCFFLRCLLTYYSALCMPPCNYLHLVYVLYRGNQEPCPYRRHGEARTCMVR